MVGTATAKTLLSTSHSPHNITEFAMKKHLYTLLCLTAITGTATAITGTAHAANINCYQLSGATIKSPNGTFLGNISSPYNSDSIFNQYGDHGSKYSDTSIWNSYGTYGGKYSDQSPFNQYASNPPIIYQDNQKIGVLTVNTFGFNHYNPYELDSKCHNNM